MTSDLLLVLRGHLLDLCRLEAHNRAHSSLRHKHLQERREREREARACVEGEGMNCQVYICDCKYY